MADLSNADLKKALVKLGKQPGPINEFTRASYVKLYNKLSSSGGVSKPTNTSVRQSTATSLGRMSDNSRKSQSPTRKPVDLDSPPPSTYSPTRMSTGASGINKSTQAEADSDDEEDARLKSRPSFGVYSKPKPLLESTRLSLGVGVGTVPTSSEKRYEPRVPVAVPYHPETSSESDEDVKVVTPRPMTSASTRLTYLRRPIHQDHAVPTVQSSYPRYSGSVNYRPKATPQRKSLMPGIKSFLQQQGTALCIILGLLLLALIIFSGYKMFTRPAALGMFTLSYTLSRSTIY